MSLPDPTCRTCGTKLSAQLEPSMLGGNRGGAFMSDAILSAAYRRIGQFLQCWVCRRLALSGASNACE